jgi:hypothetical protein
MVDVEVVKKDLQETIDLEVKGRKTWQTGWTDVADTLQIDK